MANITLSIDDEIVKKVRKLAIERHTSLNAMIRSTLQQLAAREGVHTEDRIQQLQKSYQSAPAKMGARTWTRDDLYDR